MTVKVTAPYTDRELGRETRLNEILTVSEERGELLLKYKVVEKIGDGISVSEKEMLISKIEALEKENKRLKESLKKKKEG